MPSLWPLLALAALPLLMSASVVPMLALATGLLGTVLVAVGLAGIAIGRRPRTPWAPVGLGGLLDLTRRETREPLRQVPGVELDDNDREADFEAAR